MKVKTYRALTMQDAIRSIKEELGPDAVILSTKQVRRGGRVFGLFSRPLIEVMAAADCELATSGTGGRAPARSRRRSPEESTTDESGFSAALRTCLESGDRKDSPSQDFSWRNPCSPAAGGLDQEVRMQLAHIRAELRSLHTRVCSAQPGPVGAPTLDPSAPEATLYRDLVAQGVQPLTAESLLNETRLRVPPGEHRSPVAWRCALNRTLTELIKVSGPLLGTGEKKTVLVIGATGVGKTTTVAKLAAHYRLKENRSVALLTMDTYRMAAVEQLQTYAKRLGVPCDIALTKREALEGIRRRRSSDLILIDTAGRSPTDADGLNELDELLAMGHSLETHLLLSATTSERDLLVTITRYARLPIDRLLFTKLDEASGFGTIIETMLLTGLALSYFSTGQRVPDDLEAASPERLSNLLLGGSLKPPARPLAGSVDGSARRATETTGSRRGLGRA